MQSISVSRQFVHARQYLFHAHLRPAVECVRRVAPCASQIAARQPHKNARQARAGALTLNRFEDFRDEHNLEVRLACPDSRRTAAFLFRSAQTFTTYATYGRLEFALPALRRDNQ